MDPMLSTYSAAQRACHRYENAFGEALGNSILKKNTVAELTLFVLILIHQCLPSLPAQPQTSQPAAVPPMGARPDAFTRVCVCTLSSQAFLFVDPTDNQ
jgi:hypothetical protein